MLNMFGSRQAPEDLYAPEAEKRFTRFANRHTRQQAEAPAKPVKQPCQSARATPKHLVRRAEPAAIEAPSLADQLHSDSPVSVALLRRALPSRFAKIDAETRALAKRNQAELLSPLT